MTNTGTAATTRPATDAERAATAHLPLHRRVVEVETNTDGRATIGRAKTIHRAEVVTDLDEYGESVGRIVRVTCGAKRYRNTGGKGDSTTAASSKYAVDCAKCLAAE